MEGKTAPKKCNTRLTKSLETIYQISPIFRTTNYGWVTLRVNDCELSEKVRKNLLYWKNLPLALLFSSFSGTQGRKVDACSSRPRSYTGILL